MLINSKNKVTIIEELITPDNLKYESVERKGLGHPDTLVDGLVETAEIEYAQYCLNQFGCIPHHNFDKAMLIGGMCKQLFCGGKFSQPIKLIFMGRGSKNFGTQSIPIYDIQSNAARRYLKRLLPHLDIDDPKQFICESITSSNSTRDNWFTPESIADLPEYNHTPTANDTVMMVSYYPLTVCERLALDLEDYFYSTNNEGLLYPKFSEFGQDIKSMVVRKEGKIFATLTVPQIATETRDAEEYFAREALLREQLKNYVNSKYQDYDIELIVTPQTLCKNPVPYLVTGGSCTDFGEEGAVGRGNKTHGIISSFRPNSMEAPHGKNPTYFAGKIFSYMADVIAKEIFQKTASPNQVLIQSNMGDEIFNPSNIIVSTNNRVDQKIVNNIVEEVLALGRKITLEIINKKYFVPRINI
ncbi:MAG: S-adenosylmethionine synthetase [Deltaproteobacteria bacterium]|jgi:S-adenosylmethionine synthetase|nr:S-adenosylmethionine synthetase [Deltaproteobacteria bacterium]